MDREFYEQIKNFENNASYLPYGARFEKEDESMWGKGIIYADGMTNSFFQCFMLGYQMARVVYLNQ